MDSYYEPQDKLRDGEVVSEQIVITRAITLTDEDVMYVDTYPEDVRLPTFLGLLELAKDHALGGDDDD